MFSELDNIIFPDGCEVIEIVPSQHYVFPIFKCGRSSLTESMDNKGWTFVAEKNISKIKQPITVFLRDPRDRFFSGINTFIQHLQNHDPSLDRKNILYFANRYLFLNRHYAPQFFWLLNLARFIGEDAKIKLCHMTDISKLTDVHSDAGIIPMNAQDKIEMENLDWAKLELFVYLDQILIDHIGQTMSIKEILQHVKQNHSELYKLIFQKTLDLVNVLPKT